MPIVSSKIVKQRSRGKGLGLVVYEQHVDHNGDMHEHRYYCPTNHDTAQALLDWIPTLNKSLVQNEMEEVKEKVKNGENPELIVVKHIDAAYRAIASAQALMEGDPTKLYDAAVYGQTLTDAQIDAHLTVPQRNKIRARIQYIIDSQAVFKADIREEL